MASAKPIMVAAVPMTMQVPWLRLTPASTSSHSFSLSRPARRSSQYFQLSVPDPTTLAELRWWAEKIAKQNVIARDNSHYAIENRKYVTNVSKARELSGTELGRITDPYTAMSLRLQAAFGLRREESIKIRPEWADRGNILALKDTWTKGGRAREIPIRNEEQRQVLDEAKSLAGRGSLIQADRSYVDQLRRFEQQCAAAGVHRIHGHRHQYAQVRHRELTGWSAPAAGGPRSKDLSPEQREVDRQARLTVSVELGHGRAVIAGVYLGR